MISSNTVIKKKVIRHTPAGLPMSKMRMLLREQHLVVVGN